MVSPLDGKKAIQIQRSFASLFDFSYIQKIFAVEP